MFGVDRQGTDLVVGNFNIRSIINGDLGTDGGWRERVGVPT